MSSNRDRAQFTRRGVLLGLFASSLASPMLLAKTSLSNHLEIDLPSDFLLVVRYKDRSITLTPEQIIDCFEEPQAIPFMTPSRSMPLIDVIPNTGTLPLEEFNNMPRR